MDDLRGYRELWCAVIRSAVDDYRRYHSRSALQYLQSDGTRLVMDALGLPADAMLREIGTWRTESLRGDLA